MFTKTLLIASLAAVALTTCASADSLVYVVTDSQQFGTVDLSTGAFRQIGADTSGQQFYLVPGPNGSLLSLTATGNLESINPATGATSVIGATGLGVRFSPSPKLADLCMRLTWTIISIASIRRPAPRI